MTDPRVYKGVPDEVREGEFVKGSSIVDPELPGDFTLPETVSIQAVPETANNDE